MQIELAQHKILLLPDKMVFLPDASTLVIADAHFTKDTHFRKHGIAIPSGLIQRDLTRLDQAIAHCGASRLLFLGDMFHSEENKSMEHFRQWRAQQSVEVELVIGNHDILDADWYTHAGVQCHATDVRIGDILFSHDRVEVEEGDYNVHGHIHPVIRLYGKAKQSLRLPCFWFGLQHAVLPAFGSFTGGFAIQPEAPDRVYAVAGNEIIPVQGTML